MDDCSSVTADEILEGFVRFRRAGSAYPPSGPEILKHSQDVRAERIAKQNANRPKLASPPRGIDAVPEADRAAVKSKIDALLASWRRPEASQ